MSEYAESKAKYQAFKKFDKEVKHGFFVQHLDYLVNPAIQFKNEIVVSNIFNTLLPGIESPAELKEL